MSKCVLLRSHASRMNSKLSCDRISRFLSVSYSEGIQRDCIRINKVSCFKRLLYTGADQHTVLNGNSVMPNKTLSFARISTSPEFNSEEGQKSDKNNKPHNERDAWIKRGIIFLSFMLGSGLLYKLLDKETSTKGIEHKETKLKKRRSRPVIKNPASSDEIPNDVPFLLIGGGTASFSAFRAIKSIEPKAKVLVISSESYYPYMRPPLSKEMFYNEDRNAVEKLEFKQWNGTERSLFYEPEDFYTPCSELISSENGGVCVAQGWTIKQIDVAKKVAILEDGTPVKYSKCLIATGARPINLTIFQEANENIKQKVSLYRGITDFEELDEIIEDGAQSIGIIGGGFLGSELACALSRRGNKKNLKIVQIFQEDGNMAKVLPKYLSEWTTEKVKNEGVEIYNKSTVQKVELKDGLLKLNLDNGREVSVDHVIVAVGVEPNTHLAETSKLEIDQNYGGFLVNAELLARKDVYAAGDCACFYDENFGRRRIEHHDHAVLSGRLAGENMTGAGKPYLNQPMFWSDLGPDVGYEAVGIIDSSLPTVGVFARNSGKDEQETRTKTEQSLDDKDTDLSVTTNPPKPGDEYKKGVIFYLRDDIVVGIILWNIFNKMSIARQVLKDKKKYENLNEVAKLFNIHEE